MTISAKRRMSAEVFALALGRLGISSNGRANKSFEAAAAVLIDGCAVASAVRLFGVRSQGIYKAMRRIEGALERIGICPYCGSRLDVTATERRLEPSAVPSQQRDGLNAE